MATSCKRSSGALEVKDDTPQREEGVLHIPQKDVCGFIKQEKLRCILMLLGRVPTTDDEKAAPLLQRFDTFIRWLETSVEITPELKNHTKIDKALQLVALFNGAHGTKQARIAGNSGTGAYSIVVSGQYHDLDQDHGDVLYYSGSRSHDNEDPERPGESSRATLALKASWHSGRLVRVLRASGGMSRWAPTFGLRYDGLYRVVDQHLNLNSKGGVYERFKLVRESGQTPLDSLRAHPTGTEVRDYKRIENWY